MKKSKPIGLDFLAAELGFEPRHTESESAVLPLHNSARHYLVFPLNKSSLRDEYRVCRSGQDVQKLKQEYRRELKSPRMAIFRKRNAESAVLPLYNSAKLLRLTIVSYIFCFVKCFF